jgi:hypothetical protein
MVYVEAEAKMDQFVDREGKNRTALNLVQRMFSFSTWSLFYFSNSQQATSKFLSVHTTLTPRHQARSRLDEAGGAIVIPSCAYGIRKMLSKYDTDKNEAGEIY